MKRLFYYILIPLFSWSCSASYWSAASFSGDAMYDTYDPAPKQRRYTSVNEAVTSHVQYYTPYQRPESYYQYQYVSTDSLAESSYVEDVVEPKYVSSTYGVWDETPVIETYVYVESSPYVSYYDPFYYGGWGYPYYFGWYAPIYVAPRPPRPSVSRPRPNIVQRPSSSVAPSTSSGSTRGSTTPTRVTRSSVNSSSSSSSSSRKSITPTSTRSTTTNSTTNSSTSYR